MVSFSPFKAIRPLAQHTDEVAAPPYDVMSRAEARVMIEGHPNSILRVTRPDATLEDEVQMDDPRAYHQASAELSRLISSGVLTSDERDAIYLYAQQMGSHRQTGFIGLASADDYWDDSIKKHEFTLPRKEDDRMRQVETLGAHLGPVFLTHAPHAQLSALIERYQASAPKVQHTAPDGVTHELWIVDDPADIDVVTTAFSEISALYIADGHHRAAAAARVARSRAERGDHDAGRFLCVSFASDELLVLPYQRVIDREVDVDALFTSLRESFVITEVAAPEERDPSASVLFPPHAGGWGLYARGQWYLLKASESLRSAVNQRPLTAQLDVSVLQDEVLSPLLGVDDPRTCDHISFVGGIRGFRELERRADAVGGVAFALYPTSVNELMGIADLGEVMPPKSTWFEPKLRSGLFMNVFDASATQG